MPFRPVPGDGQRHLTRRAFLQASALGLAAASVPELVSAAPPGAQAQGLVNPYSGAIPLTFPLPRGSYQALADNWHQSREGQLYTWSHRASPNRRSHDGVDIYPATGGALPTVYAPCHGTVAAVCWRDANTTTATVTYAVSRTTLPPWDYSRAVDNVANLPLYGNFIWLRSTDGAGAGYFVFFCHLQNDATLQGIAVALAAGNEVSVRPPGDPTGPATALGTVGDTGNAAGTPQLHTEIHYPSGASYTCTHCSPKKAGLTAIDPYASLAVATTWLL
jgi:hypothetical protein